MSLIAVNNLSVRFPVYGVDSRSIKKHLTNLTIGGKLGTSRIGTRYVDALTDVSFHLRAGDRLGLIGPNGAGKTTLLRCLAGAYEPDSGRIEIHGRIAALLDLSLGIDPSATGLDNIRLRGLIAGLTASEIADKLNDIAAFSGLGEYLAFPVKTYSAGMMARLAFAVTTSLEAEVLLLDEWLAVGDAEFQTAAHQRLVSLVNQAKILVFASHNMKMIKDYCNKVAVVRGGRVSSIVDVDQADRLMAA